MSAKADRPLAENMKEKIRRKFSTPQRGQALLVVVLVMVVALTVGLSVASRSVTNLRITTEEENSQRAFSAAEAGIEQVIKTGQELTDKDLPNNSTIQKADVKTISGSKFVLNNGNPVFKDDGVDIWLSSYSDFANPKKNGDENSDDNHVKFFSIYWGTTSDDCQTAAAKVAAVEIIVLYGSKDQPVTKRFTYDPCSTSQRSGNANGFTGVSKGDFSITDANDKTWHFGYKTPDGTGNTFIRSLPNETNVYLVRVVPLYSNTPVGVYTCNNGGQKCTQLPVQGKQIESTGKSGSTVRKVTFFQGHPKLPSEFFQYIIFSTTR